MRLAAPSVLARFPGPAALCVAGLLFCAWPLRAADAPTTAEANGGIRATWTPVGTGTDYRYRLRVEGFSPSQLAATGTWTPEQWRRLVSVYVGETPTNLPTVSGGYLVDGATLVFEPAFPLTPGTAYRTVIQTGADSPASTLFRAPDRPATPPTTVTQVYPSADLLPENLLKFYIHFSAPMNGGDIYKHLQLLDQDGKPVYLPFLELGEELWNPQMTRVTVFIDPGRIKRGVRELMEHGPALTPGRTHTLVVDSTWTDSHGRPLREPFRKTFRVAEADRTAIDPQQWKLTLPAAGTRAPLVIAFPEALDHALAERLIAVVALTGGTRRPFEITATLSDQERRLSLVPAQPWAAGNHALEIPMILEDLAGNKVGKVFDVDVFDEVQRTAAPEVVKLPFAVR